MSTAATPEPDVAEANPVKVGKKKLIIIVGAALLLVLIAGGIAGYFVLQNRKAAATEAAEAADDGDGDEVAEVRETKKHDKKSTPVFLPLELFTVNLSDREAERYAQVGVTLELADNKTSDLLKAYMPAIRNDILMLLAHKKAEELQNRDGKVKLAKEIRRVALKPLPSDEAKDPDGNDGEDEAPVRAVHFSAFIIQ